MENWEQGVIKFVRNLILKFEKNEKIVDKLILNEELWYKTFTHETFNPNIGENYEELEKVGDQSAALAFIHYIYKRIEGVTASEIGEYKAFYLSKAEQSAISINLGIPEWIRTPLNKTIHIFEDVLEAFFGALFLSGEEVRPGLGYSLCFNFTVFLYDKVEFEEEATHGKSKTQLKEYLEKHGLHDAEEDWQKDKVGTGGIVKLGFTENDFRILRENGINLKDRFVAQSRGNTKSLAVNAASKAFLEKIVQLKDTKTWKEFELKRKKVNPELELLLSKALIKANKQGYSDLTIKHGTTGTRGLYVQLIGIKENGRMDIFDTMSGQRLPDMKKNILIKYLE